MSDLMYNALSGLSAARMGMSVASSNIANAATPGRSRQVLDLESIQGTWRGGASVGAGVRVASTSSIASSYLERELGAASAAAAASTKAQEWAARAAVGWERLAEASTNARRAVAAAGDAPSEAAARNGAFSALSDAFSALGSRSAELGDLTSAATNEVSAAADLVSSKASSLAKMNEEISKYEGVSSGSALSLRDARNELVRELKELTGGISFETAEGVSFSAGGLSLVAGSTSWSLKTSRGPDGSSMIEAYGRTGAVAVVRAASFGGEIGATATAEKRLIKSRDEVDAQSAELARALNDWQRGGVSWTGAVGANVASWSGGTSTSWPGNGGSATLSVSVSGEIKEASLMASFDGSEWTIKSGRDGSGKELYKGSLPVDLGGLRVEATGTPQANDSFSLAPFEGAARSMRVHGSGESLALAGRGQVRWNSESATAAVVSSESASFPGKVDFLANGMYSISGGPSQGPWAGEPISGAGWVVTIDGFPREGDTFDVYASSADEAKGDGSRASALSDIMSGLAKFASEATARTGTEARSARVASEADAARLSGARDAREALSGVNLDEEAASLLRWTQMYEASGKAMSIANGLFERLLASLG